MGRTRFCHVKHWPSFSKFTVGKEQRKTNYMVFVCVVSNGCVSEILHIPTWGSGPLQCMACTSPLGLMGFYLGCHLWKVASLLILGARTLLCGLQNFPHLLSIC